MARKGGGFYDDDDIASGRGERVYDDDADYGDDGAGGSYGGAFHGAWQGKSRVPIAHRVKIGAAAGTYDAEGLDVSYDIEGDVKAGGRKPRKGRGKAGGSTGGGTPAGGGRRRGPAEPSAASPAPASTEGFGLSFGRSAAAAPSIARSFSGTSDRGAAASLPQSPATPTFPRPMPAISTPESSTGASRSHHVVSAAGAEAASARRRNRDRIHRVTGILPRPPQPVLVAAGRIPFLAAAAAAPSTTTTSTSTAATAAAVAATTDLFAASEPASVTEAAPVSGAELSLVVIGHVDSGKSTLVGHLLTLLGHVSERETRANKRDAEAIGKATFEFAWVMDRSEEERSRGVTVDVGVARFAAPDGSRNFCVLDAPGHRAFMGGAITAAAAADAAIFMAPAPEGEFRAAFALNGTAREHALMARALGVSQVLVAVSKMDACGWSEARFDEVRHAVTQFLVLGCGFKASSILFVPVSGYQGLNLVRPIAGTVAPWYTLDKMTARGVTPAAAGLLPGSVTEASSAPETPAVVEAVAVAVAAAAEGAHPHHHHLEAGEAPGLTILETLCRLRLPSAKDILRPLRVSVSDAFRSTTATAGIVAVGRVESGWLEPRRPVTVSSNAATSLSVKGLRPAGADASVGFETRALAWAGHQVEVLLGGIGDDTPVRRGAILSWPSFPVPMVSEIKARITLPAPFSFTKIAKRAGITSTGAASSSSASARGLSGAGDTVSAAGAAGARVDLYGEEDGADGLLVGTGGMLLPPMIVGSQFMLHAHSVETPCNVIRLLRTETRTGAVERMRPRAIQPGDTAVVRIRTLRPIPLEATKHHKRLGRFLLRYSGHTVAYGATLRLYK